MLSACPKSHSKCWGQDLNPDSLSFKSVRDRYSPRFSDPWRTASSSQESKHQVTLAGSTLPCVLPSVGLGWGPEKVPSGSFHVVLMLAVGVGVLRSPAVSVR